jgi:thymidylate synthase ThyX
LPASTLTHLGLFGNGRFFANLLSSLKSEELKEPRERAEELEIELAKVIPTFIKKNAPRARIAPIHGLIRGFATSLFEGITPRANRVTLVDRANYLDEVVASELFPYTNISLQQIVETLAKVLPEQKVRIHEVYNSLRANRRDRSGRGLEAGYPLVFDLVGNFAEYRDLERHRMVTQQRQDLTTELGFVMYPEMEEIGLTREVEEVVARMEDLNSDLKHAGLRAAAQYATLFNHRMRFMIGMNLREFQHLAELRTQKAAHFSYKGMVLEMVDRVNAKYPWATAAYQFVDRSDPDNRISRSKEQSWIAGQNLAKGVDGGVDLY